jgi:metal-responsive CopG/Arc/MetJ family transcriptional regulator
MLITRNISMEEKEFEEFKKFARYKEGISFSELVRKSIKFYIKKQEEMALNEYLKANCEAVSPEEEKEIIKLLSELEKDPDYDENEGSEIALEQILHGKL